MLEGTVRWFNENKGYGFIKPNSGDKDIFVHVTDVRLSGYEKLIENDEVEFEIKEDERGRQRACNITAYEVLA